MGSGKYLLLMLIVQLGPNSAQLQPKPTKLQIWTKAEHYNWFQTTTHHHPPQLTFKLVLGVIEHTEVSEGIWRVSVGCLVGVWMVSGGCLESVWKVSGKCLEVVRTQFFFDQIFFS